MQWSRNFLPERRIYHEAKPQHSSYASLWTTCSHDQCLILCFFFGYVNKQLKSTHKATRKSTIKKIKLVEEKENHKD